MKIWDKGFENDAAVDAFTVGRDKELDLLLAPFDIEGTIAHITMLKEVGLLSGEDYESLLPALQKLHADALEGRFTISGEDVHSEVEERLGPLGKKVHTGRSRNDQVALDIKLFTRHRLGCTKEKVQALFTILMDRARELNERMSVLPGVYYFSVPCSATEQLPDGTHRPKRGIEPLFAARSRQIGVYTGKTAGGLAIDERWRENDGLVNTVSAAVPTGAPFRALDRKQPVPGLWNVFPVLDGDHMWLQGGLLHRHDIRPFYLDLLRMISELP